MKFSVITATYNQLPLLKKAEGYWKKQTFKDFEWILAIDGSTDKTKEWAKNKGIKFVEGQGNYDWGVYNKAVRAADGEYVTWVMGDSYPKEDYLEQILKLLKPNRVVNGVRINVDGTGTIVSLDWRVAGSIPEGVDAIKVDCWDKMTLNSMAMSKELFEKIGGFYEKYKGYGRGDYDIAVRSKIAGAEMWCAPKAIVYHFDHKGVSENPGNIKIFDKRMKKFEKELKK